MVGGMGCLKRLPHHCDSLTSQVVRWRLVKTWNASPFQVGLISIHSVVQALRSSPANYASDAHNFSGIHDQTRECLLLGMKWRRSSFIFPMIGVGAKQ